MRDRVRTFTGFALLVLAATISPFAHQAASTRTTVDVVAINHDGRPVDDLEPGDFSATVDGQPRRILSVVQVSRGAGAASTAMSRVANGAAGVVAAEPSRVVMVVVDETMLGRGDERPAIQAASAFLDRLGLEDRVAVVRLPMSATTRVVTTTERPAIREALAAIVGRATDAGVATDTDATRVDNPDRATIVEPNRVAGGDPDKATASAERDRPQTAPDAPTPIPDDDIEKARATLGGLGNVLTALQPVPGRKVIALFSAGLPATQRSISSQIDALAAAAAGARTVIHAFGLRASRPDDRLAADFLPLDSLARKTGGSAGMLEKDPGRSVERVVQQLSTCYVLTLEPVESDATLRPRAVRVETARKGVTLRAASSVVARPDPEEAVVAAPPSETPTVSAGPRPVKRESPSELETETALSRMTAYVEGYQRAFSGLVAEEEYRQQITGREARTRSDFLLVKLETAEYWISFRDVFEVDGKPVRDREDRLKRLFLDNPTEEAVRQAQKIRDESARLNIGPVQRNFNVPLFPLTFLLPENRPRFHFTVADKPSEKGVEAWKMEFEERVRPTIIKNPRTGADVPARGYFLIDPITGTILETSLEARDDSVTARFGVHYRSDTALGLWVPADMTELYVTRPAQSLVMGGNAKYTNFRRFQVRTEEKVTIPK